jgi:hypothetical protein
LALLLLAGAPGARADDAAQLRARAEALLAHGSPDDAAKAADLLDKASQIDARAVESRRADAERRKLEQPAETPWKDLLTLLSPLLSTIILGGTLAFNVWQARITQEEKSKEAAETRRENERQAIQAEAKRMTEALELIQRVEEVSPTAALINTFTEEPGRSTMRQFGMTLIARAKTYDKFRDLFQAVAVPMTWENLPEVLELFRGVHAEVNPLLTKTWIAGTNDTSRLTPDEKERYDRLVPARELLSREVAAALRDLRKNASRPLDLSGLGFDGADLSGVNLAGAVISRGVWNAVNLDDCDLSGVMLGDGFWFYSTAWWRVRRIDRRSLDFLKANLPYEDGQRVASPVPATLQDYQDNLARLAALA